MPVKLKQVFTDRGITCITAKEKGWLGLKNGQLPIKVRENRFVLVTHDKDFTVLWKKYKIQVVYLAIEPAILEFIQPRVVDLLDNWKFDLFKPFLLMLQTETIRIWQ